MSMGHASLRIHSVFHECEMLSYESLIHAHKSDDNQDVNPTLKKLKLHEVHQEIHQ